MKGESRRFRTLGWTALALAGLAVVSTVVDAHTPRLAGSGWLLRTAWAALGVTGAAMTVVVLTGFRRMLNDRYRYHTADTALAWLARVSAGMVVLLPVLSVYPETRGTLFTILASVLVLGVLVFALSSMAAGWLLLKLDHALFGYKRPLGVLGLAGGFLILAGFAGLIALGDPLVFSAGLYAALAAGLASCLLAARVFFLTARRDPDNWR